MLYTHKKKTEKRERTLAFVVGGGGVIQELSLSIKDVTGFR